MALSPGNGKLYCFLCKGWNGVTAPVPPLATVIGPCTKHSMSKGVYDPPCSEGDFVLDKRRLAAVVKVAGKELATNRLALRLEAYGIQCKQGVPVIEKIATNPEEADLAKRAEVQRESVAREARYRVTRDKNVPSDRVFDKFLDGAVRSSGLIPSDLSDRFPDQAEELVELGRLVKEADQYWIAPTERHRIPNTERVVHGRVKAPKGASEHQPLEPVVDLDVTELPKEFWSAIANCFAKADLGHDGRLSAASLKPSTKEVRPKLVRLGFLVTTGFERVSHYVAPGYLHYLREDTWREALPVSELVPPRRLPTVRPQKQGSKAPKTLAAARTQQILHPEVPVVPPEQLGEEERVVLLRIVLNMNQDGSIRTYDLMRNFGITLGQLFVIKGKGLLGHTSSGRWFCLSWLEELAKKAKAEKLESVAVMNLLGVDPALVEH